MNEKLNLKYAFIFVTDKITDINVKCALILCNLVNLQIGLKFKIFSTKPSIYNLKMEDYYIFLL